MAAALVNDIIMDSSKVFATVELRGHCRGQMVVDWNGTLKKEATVCIVLAFDNELYDKAMMDAVS